MQGVTACRGDREEIERRYIGMNAIRDLNISHDGGPR